MDNAQVRQIIFKIFNDNQCRPYKTISRQAAVCRQTVSLLIKKYKEYLNIKKSGCCKNCGFSGRKKTEKNKTKFFQESK